jgi:hypothetical protein
VTFDGVNNISTLQEDVVTTDPSLSLDVGFSNDYTYKPSILPVGDFYLVSGKIHHLRVQETASGAITLSQIAQSHTGSTSACANSMTFMDVTGGALPLATETGYYACKRSDG